VSDHDLVHRLDPHINWRSCKTRGGKCPLAMSVNGSAIKSNVTDWARTSLFLKAKGLNFQTLSLSLTFKLPKHTPALYYSLFFHFSLNLFISSNGQIWPNRDKSEYPGGMRAESRHVRSFGELGKAR
ncbi:hypothetical protein H5410_046806, partial [Solanum commersonii]